MSQLALDSSPATQRVAVRRHGLVVRVTHWLNALAWIFLLMSGLQIFNAHPAVFRSALVGVNRLGQVEPVLCVEREAVSRKADTSHLTRELLELGGRFDKTRMIQTVLYHDAFPVDIRHNSKIFREKLAVWATTVLKRI